jgi:hypothetical protein
MHASHKSRSYGLTVFGTGAPPVTRSFATAEGFLRALTSSAALVQQAGTTPQPPPTTQNLNGSSTHVPVPAPCSDFLFHALLEASQDAPRRAELRVFADTGTLDGELAGLASATTLSKQQTVRFFLTGGCGSEGPSNNSTNSTQTNNNVTNTNTDMNSTAGIDPAIRAFAHNTGSLVVVTNKSDIFNSLRLVSSRLLPGAAVVFSTQMPTRNESVPGQGVNACNVSRVCHCARVNVTLPAWGSSYVFYATYRDQPGLLAVPLLFGPAGVPLPILSR